MSKPNAHTEEMDGFVLTFTMRRGSVDCDIIRDGQVVSELRYPRLRGYGDPSGYFDLLAAEAVMIAKRDWEKSQEPS